LWRFARADIMLRGVVLMDFRAKLLCTLRAVEPVLREPGVLVAGSEVPNLLEPNARSTLVVSQDVDIAVPVEGHASVKRRLSQIRGLVPSEEEPSVWLPVSEDLIEVNFIGMETHRERPGKTYVLEDKELPLLVFPYLSLLSPGEPVRVEDLVVPVPRPAGLLLEKLLTDRSGEKGDRDLLVALGLLLLCTESDREELVAQYCKLQAEEQYAVRSGLSMLSLLEPRAHMPDPTSHRGLIAGLMARLERAQPSR